MKEDQERVRTLITQTITMICKKGLKYEKELKVQGLIGVTIDSKDVVLVHVNEKYEAVDDDDDNDCRPRLDSGCVSAFDKNQKKIFSVEPCSSSVPSFKSFSSPKAEPDLVELTLERSEVKLPTYADLQDTMSDLFQLSECHTTQDASSSQQQQQAFANVGIDDHGFLMDIDAKFSSSTLQNFQTNQNTTAGQDLKPVMNCRFGQAMTGDGENQDTLPSQPQSSSEGVILLDSGDEGDNGSACYRSDVGQGQGWPDFEARRTIKVEPEENAALQNAYRQNSTFQTRDGAHGGSKEESSSAGFIIPSQQIFHGTPPTRGSRRGTPGPGGPSQSRLLSPRCLQSTMQSPRSANSSFIGGFLSPVRMPSVRGSPRTKRPHGSPGSVTRGGDCATAGSEPGFSGMNTQDIRGGRGAVKTRTLDGYAYGKQTVTNYICQICQAVYKNHSSLLAHQVKVHGRQKKEGRGRKPKVAGGDLRR